MRNNKYLYWLFISIWTVVMVACSPTNEPTLEGNKPLIILDTDIGSSTDDLFAMEMLYDYDRRGLCKLLGVIVNREGENCAACADVMNTWHGYGALPIGHVKDGLKNPKVWIDYRLMPYYKLPDSAYMFRRSIADYSALPDGWKLYRKLLSRQKDHSVTICSIGFLVCMAQLLQSEGDEYSPLNGVELVRQKVREVYLQGGVFSTAEEPDFNMAQGPEFAHEFFRLFPKDVEIIFSPMEAGQVVEYVPEQVIADIDWTDIHPVKQVYMTCNCHTGQRMWDVCTIMNAVEEDLFLLSEPGTVVLTPECYTVFTPDEKGNCRYQILRDAMWADNILNKIRELARWRPSK
jgi:inosine-uridine nucleoside N-ribohydrolase